MSCSTYNNVINIIKLRIEIIFIIKCLLWSLFIDFYSSKIPKLLKYNLIINNEQKESVLELKSNGIT